MNDQQKQIAEEIIKFIKSKNTFVSKTTLSREFHDVDRKEYLLVLYSLRDDYNFLNQNGESFILNSRGEKFTTFEQYEKDQNRTPWTSYQKAHVLLTAIAIIVSASAVIYSNYKNKNQINNSEFESFRDSINETNTILKERIYFLENRDSIGSNPK